MEQFDKRSAKPQVGDASAKPVEKLISGVEWLEPKNFRLHIAPPQSSEGPDKLENAAAVVKQAENAVSIGPRANAAIPVTELARPAPPSMRENPATADELLTKLSRAVKDDPKNLSAHLDLQLLHLLLGHPTPQMDTIASLSAEDRELIAAVLDGFNNFPATTRTEFGGVIGREIKTHLGNAHPLRGHSGLFAAQVPGWF